MGPAPAVRSRHPGQTRKSPMPVPPYTRFGREPAWGEGIRAPLASPDLHAGGPIQRESGSQFPVPDSAGKWETGPRFGRNREIGGTTAPGLLVSLRSFVSTILGCKRRLP
jgi:hypothetical protein